MNWEALGALAELLGALGVIVTLAYLARQINNNSKQLWSQNIHAQTQEIQDSMTLQSTPHMAEVVDRAYYNPGELTTKDTVLLESYFVNHLVTFRSDFLHYQKKLLSAEEWQARSQAMVNYFEAEAARRWWVTAKVYWEPAFVAEVDAILSAQTEKNYIDSTRSISEDSKG